AAAVWLGTHIVGPSESGVRLLAPLLSLGSSLMVFSLARRLYSEAVGIWSVAAINLMPVLQLSTFTMTTEPLSLFCWTTTLYTFWRALEHPHSQDAPLHEHPMSEGWNGWWPATGAMLGLGVLCSWTSLVQLASMLLLLSSCPRFRRYFRAPGFWMMLAVFMLMLLPTLLWNAENEWICLPQRMFGTQFNVFSGIFSASPLHSLAAHAAFYSPLLFCAIAASLWRETARARNHLKPRFLLAFTLPLLGLCLLLPLEKKSDAIGTGWTGAAFLSAAILGAADWLPRARVSAVARRFLGAALGLGLIQSALVLNPGLLHSAGFALPQKMNPTAQFQGWRTVSETVERIRLDFEKSTNAPVFLIASDWKMASELAFYLKDKRLEFPDHPPVYTPESQAIEDQYSFWPRYDANLPLQPGQSHPDALYTEEAGFNPFHGRRALFLSDSEAYVPPSSITGAFEKSELLASFDIVRHGDKIRKLRIFACSNYQGRAL
ncbi:MAG: hypothetical protein EBS01_12995, partial [Verrucomicrobia bacterium]|nr:hypothetical protein [Verrucomicrobiota bacterium]